MTDQPPKYLLIAMQILKQMLPANCYTLLAIL
jgi:hypothetical protein